ncbi:ABC transporter permease [Neptunomonas antarctica]|nr:FtsX-like permease family protein [Neptunomonas antarctica]
MLLASLVIAASGLSSVLIINDSAKQSYSSDSTLLVPNVSYHVVAANLNKPLTKQDYARLRQLGLSNLIAVARKREHIYAVNSPRGSTEQTYLKISKRAVDFTGIDTFALIANSGLENMPRQGSTSSKTRANLTGLSFSQPVGLLHPHLLASLTKDFSPFQLRIEKPTLNDKSPKEYITLPTLAPIEEASLGNDIIMDIGLFIRLFPASTLTGLLWIQDPDDAHFEKLKADLESKLPSHLRLQQLSSANEQGELTKSFHLNLLAMALLMFVVCLFIVLNAVNLLINSRMGWLKICRQLGIPRSTIFLVQLIEITLLTLLSVILGIVLGLYLSNIVSPSVQATLEGLYQVQVGFGRISLLSLFLQVFGISLIGSIGAVFIPFKQVDKSLANNNNNSKAAAQPMTVKLNILTRFSPFWLAAFILAACAILLLLYSTQLWLLLMATACVILSGCAVLLANYPVALKALSYVIPDKFPLLQVSTQQSIVLSGKTKIACCAFFIAATSNIGMNLMVDSFRGATVSWLDSRLASDYYLYYQGDKDISQVAAAADIEIYQRFENTVSYQGQKIQQFSYPTTEKLKQAMVFYQVGNETKAWQAFAANKAIFINQQLAFYFGLALGDKIQLPHPTTQQPTEYEILGIIYDFGSPDKQALLPISAFSSAVSKSSMYAIEANEKQIERFKTVLETVGINHNDVLIKTDQLLARSMQAFDNTFLITDGLNIVTLLVAALSLACAIIVLMDDVRPQNMLIRSLGVSSLKTQLLALLQYLLLCLVALIFSTPFGILLSWVLIFEINYQAFQWTYPLQIDLLKILQIYGVSLVVVITVITIPLLRASKKPLIEDIRWLN